MSLPAGTHRLGPADGRLTVRTGRAGVAAAAGHDLVLDVARWSGVLQVGPEGNGSLALTADARSFEVRSASGGAKPLGDGDRRQILRSIFKVLVVERHPEITFTSTSVRPSGEQALAVEGELRLAGSARPVGFDVELEPQDDETLARAAVAIEQTAFGIEPFSAFMGTLKVADTVQVSCESRLR